MLHDCHANILILLPVSPVALVLRSTEEDDFLQLSIIRELFYLEGVHSTIFIFTYMHHEKTCNIQL